MHLEPEKGKEKVKKKALEKGMGLQNKQQHKEIQI